MNANPSSTSTTTTTTTKKMCYWGQFIILDESYPNYYINNMSLKRSVFTKSESDGFKQSEKQSEKPGNSVDGSRRNYKTQQMMQKNIKQNMSYNELSTLHTIYEDAQFHFDEEYDYDEEKKTIINVNQEDQNQEDQDKKKYSFFNNCNVRGTILIICATIISVYIII